MFSPSALALVALSFFTIIAVSAPTSPDAATLLKNGQEAQGLNFAFRTLSANDDCTSGDTGCILGASAQCVDGKWDITNCPSQTRCYALPSFTGEGTFVACTSERNARSFIDASGAEGGIAVAPSNSTNSANSTASASSTVSSSIARATASTSKSVDESPKTVTVTFFPSSSSSPAIAISTDLPAQTITVAPAAASSLVASITANTAFSVVSVIQPSGAAFPADAPNAKPAATTIKLTAAALPVQTTGAVVAANNANAYGY
ncbi:hypothetical protein PC9H_006154 [Pleurotus ostreatus]|uniref:Carbohydrate-binding module family 19 domain-containing protein n=1 Tax=Pleurotus ostreatus TaxID=5322 RepID=A0A8H6ZX39_PLEOS|nr:uncharacterized protein PC9H_006154 [Pleurotus ostreatus]KAF7430447.1 hypothetical protein PC9H_006154 [Pleurotus ostreatus]KAJ8701617.1 hypothetical protein PTI98_000382 [Pleurotus ostreatus]